MQKKAITIENRINRPQICNWSQREARKRKSLYIERTVVQYTRLYLGFAIIQTR